MPHLELLSEAGLAARLNVSTHSLRRRHDLPRPIVLGHGGRHYYFLSDVAHLLPQRRPYCDLVRVDELAELLGISVPWVYALIKRGKIPPGRRIDRRMRWSRRDVEAHLRALPPEGNSHA